MPKVKTIAPGRLTGISGLTETAAAAVGRQKDMEFAFEMSEWQKQRDKLERLQQQETDLITERMKIITTADGVGKADFNAEFKESLMGQAKEYARINSRMKLGDIDIAEGARDLASIDNQLNTFVSAAPNMQAFYDKIIEADGKISGEVGSILMPVDVNAAKEQNNIIETIKTLYSSNSGDVKTEFKDGKTFLVGKNGTRISLDGLNDIMSGENPEYPIQFVQSPDAAIDPLYKAFNSNTKNLQPYIVDDVTVTYDKYGGKSEIVKKVYEIGEGSKYRKDLKEVVSPILDDKKAMETYWPNLKGGQNSGPWLNTTEQRGEALELLMERADSLYGPKVDVKTSPSGEETYEDIIKKTYEGKKPETRAERLRRKLLEKQLKKSTGSSGTKEDIITFDNVFKQKYGADKSNKFLAKREKLDELQNYMVTIRKSVKDNNGVTEELIDNLAVTVNGIKEEYEKNPKNLNTAEKLEITLKEMFELDEEFFIMQKDFERYLKDIGTKNKKETKSGGNAR